MRSLNAAALAKIATTKGTEPVIIIDVNWHGAVVQYADKIVDSIPGKILNVTNLDAIVNIDSSSDSQEINITLDDIDGNIKTIIDNYDIHMRDVQVYQWFEGLDLADRFLLFKGRINSPITWNESERTLSFDIVSNLEDNEIGYSAEEGQFENMPNNVIGQSWPMCFGTTIFSKTLRLTSRVKGTLADGLSFPDFALAIREQILASIVARDDLGRLSFYLQNDSEFQAYLVRLGVKGDERLATVRAVLSHQPPLNTSPRIIGGENLPQINLTYIKIGNTTFLGRMNNNIFTFYPNFNQHPNVGNFHTGQSITTLDRKRITHDNVTYTEKILPYENKKYFHIVIPSRDEGGRDGYARGWYLNGEIFGDNAGYVSIQPGAQVSVTTAEPQTYVVSIVPGTVKRVSAWVEKDGQRFLQDVDPDNYTVYTESYGDLTVTFLELDDALSKKREFNWSDDVYVIFESTIGPNTVDILQYIIETYSDFSVDATSFTAVKTKVENYPSHFAITERKELFTVLQEIAWQARCSIWLKNGVFFIKYLSEEPTPTATITESDIEINSLILKHTPTEDLITKMVCKWRESGLQEDPYKTTLRHNIAKYGVHEQNYDFYIYNFADAVIKSATFWMIRYANTWKKIEFDVPLTLLNVETFDAVTLDFGSNNYVANEDVIAVVENATYNSAENVIEMECWCPVKAGTITSYYFAYPAQVDEVATFPTEWEVQQGFDGGNSPGRDDTIREGFDPTLPLTVTYPVSDPYNLGVKQLQDRGNPTPSDIGDVYPGIPIIKSATPLSPKISGAESIAPGIKMPSPYQQVQEPVSFDPRRLLNPDDVTVNPWSVQVNYIWYQRLTHLWGHCDGSQFTMAEIEAGIPTRTGQRGISANRGAIMGQEIFLFNTWDAAFAFGRRYDAWAHSFCAIVGSPAPSHASNAVSYYKRDPFRDVVVPEENEGYEGEPLESDFPNGMIGYRAPDWMPSYIENFGIWDASNGP